MRKRPLFMAACVFLMGICYRDYGGIIWLMGLGFLIIYGNWPCIKKNQTGKMLLSGIIFCLLFLAGLLKTSQEEEFKNRYLLELQDGDRVTIQGEIYHKEQKTYQIYYYLKNTYIQLNGRAIPCNQVIAYMSQDLYPIETTIIAEGKVSFFEEARNEGNFDTRTFYSSQKIDFAVEDMTVKKSIPPAFAWQEWLYQLRSRLKNTLLEIMEEKEGGVLAGMLLGDKSSLNKEVKEAYKEAGISHVLAISGLHISIFASGIYGFLRKRGMGYFSTGIISFFFLICYACMTGNGISTQRAAGMFLITIIGAIWGRSSDLLNSLGAVVLCLLWENPGLIEYAGFQLSVVAILSIGIVNEVRRKREMMGKSGGLTQEKQSEQEKKSGSEKDFGQEKKLGQEKGFGQGEENLAERLHSVKEQMIESFILSGFIQLGTLPLIAYHYFEVPIYSVFLNVFLLPFMSYLLPLGAFGAVIGLFWKFPAQLILLPGRGILWLYEKCCSLMLKLPFSQWITGQPEAWKIAVYYLILSLGVLFWYAEKKKRWIYLADGLAVLFSLFGKISLQPEISILDVGQGDGIFIQAENGTSMFIDGGSTDVNQVGTYRILPFLKSKCVRKIDYWFVSHADNDHISGFMEVLESGYPVENVVFSSAIPQDEAWKSLADLAEASGSQIIYLNQGDSLTMGQEAMTCLFPAGNNNSMNSASGASKNTKRSGNNSSESSESADRNGLSMVLLWESGSFSGIFTGDISQSEENKLLESGIVEEVDFYKAAHHGSNSSNSNEFLSRLSPKISVISCGEDNSYGHPGEEAVLHMEDAGSEVFYTMKSGQITIETESEGEVRSWLVSD